MKRNATFVAIPLLVAAVFWSGFQTARDDDFYAMRKNFELFGAVYEQVVGAYMDRVEPERFMRTGMDAMLQTLDPWTDFLDEADNVAMALRGQSGLAEVDINLGTRNGRVTVLAPDALTGAYEQGVQLGDVVVSVAGQPADSMGVVDIYQLLRGQENAAVEMVVDRGGEELMFQLRREPPVVNFVSYGQQIEGTRTALVKLDAFGPGSAREIDDALEDIEEAMGEDLEEVVLDLRGNPGGLVSEAISIVGLFVPKDSPVVSTRGKSPDSNRLYSTGDDPDWAEVRLVLLVDAGSASASEIVSGALQDLDRAVVMGEPTFGKGLVQIVRPMPYNTSLKMTYSRYYTPAGRAIRKDGGQRGGAMRTFRTTRGRSVTEGNGIEPDVQFDTPAVTGLEEALLREAAYFRYAGVLASDREEELRAAAQREGQVVLPEGTLGAFRSWLQGSGFAHRTALEARLADLEALGVDGTAGPIAQLRSVVGAEEQRAFEAAADRILEGIRLEVAARLLTPEERIRQSLAQDEVLREAVEIIGSSRYEQVLGT